MWCPLSSTFCCTDSISSHTIARALCMSQAQCFLPALSPVISTIAMALLLSLLVSPPSLLFKAKVLSMSYALCSLHGCPLYDAHYHHRHPYNHHATITFTSIITLNPFVFAARASWMYQARFFRPWPFPASCIGRWGCSKASNTFCGTPALSKH